MQKKKLLIALAEMKLAQEKRWKEKLSAAIMAQEASEAVEAQSQLYFIETAFDRMEDAVLEHF